MPSSLRVSGVFAVAVLLFPTLMLAAEWKLVWSDEFDYQGPPDPAKWDYEEGFVRNNEAQYYTRDRRENARVEDGMLVIEGRKEKFANARYSATATRGPSTRPFADYTAASIITRKKADWTFGRIEVRAKLPQGRGVWPAIWMLGTSGGWPAGGEIDIMEFVGHTPDVVHATVHFRKDGKHLSSGNRVTVEKPFDDFHLYAVEWFPDRMDFYFDKQKYHMFPISRADDNNQNPFLKPQYLLINLALGGSWGGKIDDSIFPQKFLVDYVRVYQQQDAPPGK
ncbi:MAG: glycoside hydrolase family 16 protein [Planctomycetota bacterium]|nr:glycoside hydrolase family 16 protein [Planctomycetota bacterium]